MKKSTTLLALIWTIFVQSQNNVITYVHKVQPDSICQGDSISIFFTLNYGQPGTYTNTVFKMHFINASTAIWQGHCSALAALPQHNPDTLLCHVLKIKTPIGYPVGPVFVESDGSMAYTEYMACLNAVGIYDNKRADAQMQPRYFTLSGKEVDHPVPGVLFIEQRGLNRKKIMINE